MKKLLPLLLLLSLCVACRAGSLVTATITVTNTPSDGDTILVNGSTRTWKDSVATPSSQIAIGASIGANATNLFSQFAGTAFTTLTLGRSGTNAVTLRGIVDQTIAVTIAGTWGEYTLETNTTTAGENVRVPASSYATASKATNIVSQLIVDLGAFSTSSIPAAATALAHHANLTTSQTLSNKTLILPTLTGGITTNLAAGIGEMWVSSNAAFYGLLYLTNTTPTLITYDSDGATNEKMTRITTLSGKFAIETVDDTGVSSETIMQVGRSGITVTVVAFPEGEMQIYEGLNLSGHLEYPRTDYTSLANGNNAGVDFGESIFVKIDAGPSAAFTICGIENGSDGREYKILNATGYNMTIANDSGVDATPANRIYTGTGSDIATTGNGFVTLIYDSEDSRWIVESIRD